MTEKQFNKGGIVHGEANFYVKVVDYPSWNQDPMHKGWMVLYADECVINRDRMCTRTDDIHKRFPPYNSQADPYSGVVHKRFWYCPLHDKEDRRGRLPGEAGPLGDLPSGA
jgi:hypothetical protein